MKHDVDERVDLAHAVSGGLGLGAADVGLAVDDLALQVGLIDGVVVDDPEGPDPRRSQVHQCWGAQSACADAEHPSALESLLPGHRHVGDDQVAAVAADLLDSE